MRVARSPPCFFIRKVSNFYLSRPPTWSHERSHAMWPELTTVTNCDQLTYEYWPWHWPEPNGGSSVLKIQCMKIYENSIYGILQRTKVKHVRHRGQIIFVGFQSNLIWYDLNLEPGWKLMLFSINLVFLFGFVIHVTYSTWV